MADMTTGEVEAMLGLDSSRPLDARAAYLRAVGQFPRIRERWYDGSVRGEYNFPENQITLMEGLGATRPTTMAHEMAHAADNALSKQYSQLFQQARSSVRRGPNPPTPAERQFVSAYPKLVPSDTKLRTGFENATATDRNYRTNSDELSAFGAGNMVPRPAWYVGGWQGAPHLDATMATEREILMDLATRAHRSR